MTSIGEAMCPAWANIKRELDGNEAVIQAGATVSQYSYLCTASHDFTRRSHPLVSAPIRIGRQAWVAADVFVGPGVTVGEGAVVGARSTVLKDVPAWMVVAGHPPRVLRPRTLSDD